VSVRAPGRNEPPAFAPRSGEAMTDPYRSDLRAESSELHSDPDLQSSDERQLPAVGDRGGGGTPHRRRPRGERSPDAPRGFALDVPAPSPSHPPEIAEELLDPEAVRVIARLTHMGQQAYLVGGCVRDLLLGRRPKDFDVATSAHPGEVRALFRNCRLIGRRFRLAHVYFRGGKVIEVATFRKNPVDAAEDLPDDGDLLITRDNVFGTAEEDALRRDFTVNGLFYDVFAGEVIDYVGGRADLEAHRIATIGDPEIRIREDPVRALRAVRFAARLGCTIEPETFAAMRRHSGEIARCAPPRLLEETFKILRCGRSARAFELLRSSGALPVLLPAVANFLEGASEDDRRRLAAHLAALDELVRDGGEASEAVLLGALLLHLRTGDEEQTSQRDRLLDELVAAARLPRRIAERTRLALSAQRTFHGVARRRRRGFATQAYFRDALQLLRITVRATGDGEAALERWSAEAESAHHGEAREGRGRARGRELAAQSPAPEEGGAGAASGEPAPRHRRRRGGRRRRRRGPGGPGAAPPAESAPRALPPVVGTAVAEGAIRGGAPGLDNGETAALAVSSAGR
jgi:poly(A) polymerase